MPTLLVCTISIVILFKAIHNSDTNQGISQVLIVTCVNLSKFATTQDLAKTITVATQEWESPATPAGYDVALGHLRARCERCGNSCGCRP
jgi:hypothetical protein